jgi:crotonobetainyl-CoA:carnitine CoA-transferase CaiB-like acyl-CoA transferase
VTSPPLEGLRVLDLSRLLPGPFATLLLADFGADIIKIEAPRGGDYARWYPPHAAGTSALFGALNRNKRSIALDLKHPDGAALLRRMVRSADVLIESFRPGVMDRLGVGYEALRQENPALIYCAITGFGQTGPMAQRAGHDLNYLAVSGLLSTGGDGDRVVPPGFQAADIAGGSLYGVIGVLAALYDRQRTGLGRLVDVSMTDGVAGFGLMLHAKQHLDHQPVDPGGDLLAGGRPCYRVYQCADQRHLAVAALEPKFWTALCAALSIPHLVHDGLATGARGQAVITELQAIFSQQPRDAWIAQLANEDVCVEPVLTMDEVGDHPLAQHAGWLGTHSAGDGDATLCHQRPNPRLLPDTPLPAVVPAPALGGHTREILTEYGLTTAEIDALAAAGAVSVP